MPMKPAQLIRDRFAGRKDPEELRAQGEELEEWLESRLDPDDDDCEEQRGRLLTGEQIDSLERAEDLAAYEGVRAVMGIMPYEGAFIPTGKYLHGEDWAFDSEAGIPSGSTWGNAVAYCWKLAGVSEPVNLPKSLRETADAIEGRAPALAAAIRAGLRSGAQTGVLAGETGDLFLEMEPAATSEPVLWQAPGEICCFIPPFLAGHDRLPAGRMSAAFTHDLRIDPTQPPSHRSAILCLNLNW